MAGKSQPMSTFAIRFNPASVADDDDDELYDIGNTRPRKEALQFERRSASPQPNSDVPVNPVEVSDAGVASSGAGAEQMPALHPSTLWKSPMHAVRSAPASETTSPVSPLKTNTPSESDKSVLNRDIRAPGGAKDDSQRSIFSELRERIVNQSREMLPKRLNKTGSNDTAKIVMTPADDDKSAVEKETKGIRGHSRPGSDGGEAIAKEILKAGSTECISGEWEKPNDKEEVSVKKSLSAGQIALKQESSADSELPGSNDVTTSNSLFPDNIVSMSGLLSSNGRESPDVVATEVASDTPALPETVVRDKKQKSLSYFSRRIKHVKAALRIPSFLKTQNVLALLILFLSLLILPLPPFLSGFVAGSFVMALLATVVYNGFLAPARAKEIPPLRDLKSLPPLQVPEMKESKNTEGLFKGWMNELSDYDVDNYHINQMHSIFVTLEGSTMRLQTPKQGVAKRAMWDESIPTTVSFVRQKHYDLRGCEVSLLPSDLIEKRLWSKKYPICIEVTKRPVADPHNRVSREHAKRNSFGRIEGDFMNLDPTPSPASAARAAKSPIAVGHIKHLFLFARSSREKEEWYRRFLAAAAETPWPTRMSDLLQKKSAASPTLLKSHVRNGSASSIDQQVLQHKRHGSTDSQCSSISWESLPSPETDYARLAPEKNLVEYMTYMAKIMPASESGANASAPSSSSAADMCDAQLLWLNAIISRCFHDFLREKYWTNKIRDKIQKKLGKMHVPHFIDQLTVTGIELGPQVPVICRTSKPYLDDRGLWVDMDVSYGGGFGITMETKCNLMKLKSAPSVVVEEKPDAGKRSGAQFSDEEDSAESTTDEEGVEENSTEDANSDKRSEPMSKKLLKFVDKISKSRYFQQATDYRYIKKAMEEVSNTRLVLNVEMKAVNGTLAVNIPPPPTNRIWYGFRGNPNLVLSAKPRVGEHEVSLSHITDWIEKKLAIEFQRVFVMPNMDDIPIPLMCEHLPSTQVTTTAV